MATIKAILFFYSAKEEINRNFHSGYRPAFKIRNDNEFSSGEIKFIGKNIVKSGETIEGYITFLFPEQVKDYLKVEKKFTFYEGSKCVGEGMVLEIISMK